MECLYKCIKKYILPLYVKLCGKISFPNQIEEEYNMDDYKDTELDLCVKHIENVSEDIVPLYDNIEKMILPHVELDEIRDSELAWMANAGRSAESGMSNIKFEKYVRSLEATKNTNVIKILYWHDLEALLNATQDRLSSIILNLQKFYSLLPLLTEPYDDTQIKGALLSGGEDGVNCYTSANMVFIDLASIFDILSKLACELVHFPNYNFSHYPKLKSRNVLYQKNLQVPPVLKQNGMLFSEPPIVRKIETLRNEYVHNGPWDRFPAIYNPKDQNGRPLPAFMQMPDMNADGTFVSVINRNKFYSQKKKLNEELVPIINEALDVINSTIKGLKEVAYSQTDKSESTDETDSTIEAIEKHIENLRNL